MRLLHKTQKVYNKLTKGQSSRGIGSVNRAGTCDACVSSGDKPEKAELLSAMQVVVARTELKVPVGSEGRELELLLLPTPRCARAP